MAKKPPKKTSASSNLKSIKDIPKNFKTKAELQQHLDDVLVMFDAQKREIQRLETDLEEKSTKISHLEKILENSVPKLGTDDPFQLDEVTIARMQLNRLGKIATQRDLTNEEARRFEIFSRVVQTDHKLDKPNNNKSKFRDVTPAKLIEIAANKTDKIDE